MNEQVRTSVRSRGDGATKAIIALVVLAVAFGATMVTNRSGQHVNGFSHTVSAGGFQFSYPGSWGTMPTGALPSSGTATNATGDVVAGLCPGQVTGCTSAKVDVMYVLFNERSGVAGPAELEQQLDSSLPRSLATFHKVAAETRTASDRTPFLRYEFTFTSNGVARREVIGAYRSSGGKGVLVVATGPTASFDSHASQIDRMLGGAHDDSLA